MIKVCHIVNHITGKADGVYTHLKMIFRYTDRSKFQHYLIFQGGEKIEKELSEMGIKVFISKSFKKKISLKAFYDIYKFIKENDINIINTHLIKPYAIGGLLNIFLRKKFIFNYHGLFIYNNIYYSLIEKIIYGSIHFLINIFKAVDSVLVPSMNSRELLLSETKLFPEPVVYYNGYDPQNVNKKPNQNLLDKIGEIKKSNKIIAVVGRLERQKRVDRAIELFGQLSKEKRDISLLIFGDGELKESLTEYVSLVGLQNKIFFFDFVQNISSYFNLFDVMLFTSDWEGMPLTMWEAMANKVPLVAPDVGGFREILEENNCGLVYEPGNLDEAKGKLLNLIDNEELKKIFGENGFKTVGMKFNSEKFKNIFEAVYLKLVS